MAATSKEPILAFDSPRAWEAWLARHHAGSEGVWLRIYKKASGKASVTYAEAAAVRPAPREERLVPHQHAER